MPSELEKGAITLVGLLKINTSTYSDGLDHQELRTVCGLQKIDQVNMD
jgi:hypothetical protein